jgi:hypothetical protein
MALAAAFAQHSNPESLMSALGHKRTFSPRYAMSALPPKADIDERECHVRFVPKADISQCNRHVRFLGQIVSAIFRLTATQVLGDRRRS